MEITPQCVVALTWTLKDSLGDTLDELEEPVEFLVGSDDLLPAISGALQGHERGKGCQFVFHCLAFCASCRNHWSVLSLLSGRAK